MEQEMIMVMMGDDHKMIKCSTWNKRKRKTKPFRDQGKGIS
jgi:hypothetical protein